WQVAHSFDLLFVDRHDDIALLESGCRGGTAGSDFGNERTGGVRESQVSGDFGCHGLDLNAEPPARDFAVFLQLLDHRPGSVRRYRKTDADGSTIGRIDGRVDADDITLEVEGRAAGIAPVHRRIDLQKIVVRTGVNVTSAPGNDAAAYGIVEAERAADREHP